MKERPILFSATMVRALLDGSKTQTRRVFQAKNGGVWPAPNDLPGMRQVLRSCPYGQPGDRLWVRESIEGTWGCDATYCADDSRLVDNIGWDWLHKDKRNLPARKIPSIHMPRWASRITLEITGVRVERLQEISEAEASAEGVKNSLHLPGGRFANENFAHLWETINGDGSWDANPWVWVVEFKRVEGGAA